MLSTLTKKNLSIKKLSDHHQVAKLCFQISKKAKILVKYAARLLRLFLKDAEYNSDCAQTFFFKKTEPKFEIKKKYPRAVGFEPAAPGFLSQVLNLSAKRAIVNRRNFLVYNLVCPI
jgi:hypothetical protein